MAKAGILDARRSLLEERLRSEVSLRDVMTGEPPRWFTALLNDLVLAIGSADIRYLSANLSPGAGARAGLMAVVVFTDELVAYATLDPDPALGPAQFEVIVTARRSLTSFAIETTETFDFADENSDGMRISVSYPSFSRTLPLGESQWQHRGSDTRWLLRCLRDDLKV